jgi:uncharacterized protein DUF4300
MKRIIFISLFFLLLAEKSVEAAPIKISFLDNEDAIKQTTEFLLAKGCDQESVRSFRRVIDWYNSTPTDLDLKKFPQRENGFYSFQSVSNLVEALPHPLIYTRHQYELNCFDTMILLAGNLIQTKLQPDEIAGPFLVPATKTNHVMMTEVAATPRDAFNEIWPSFWLEATKNAFSETMQNKRICLTTAFDSYYYLPLSTTKENFGDRLLQMLRSRWKQQEVKFPKNIKIVICYNAMLDAPQNIANALSSHVGLLFQNREQYVFIEKLGVSAPYVQIDFNSKKDILVWLRAEIEPIMDKREFLLVSFNDLEVKSLDDVGD